MKKTSSSKKASVFKRFIGNRNTVTLLGILACVSVLLIGYNYRVNQAINPIAIPYAKVSIPKRTLITSEMVGKIKVSTDFTSNATNLVSNVNDVINKYASYKTNIPKNSLFYSEMLKNEDEMPDHAFADIEDGYTIYSLDVSLDDTYANSIREGDYIDLYMSTNDPSNSNLVMYGKLIESIRVLAVKDASGNNILKSSAAYGKPTELLFAVQNDMYLLLMQAEFITDTKIKIEPVIRNQNYTAAANETRVSSEQLQTFIKDRVSNLTD